MHARTLIAAATVALIACHSAPPPKSPAGLPGRTFLLEASQGAELLAGVRVHLHFTDGSLSMTASCNHMGGAYTLEQERLVMGDMMQTEMGCDAERHAQDDWLQKFLASKPKLVLEGTKLTLSNDSSSLAFLDREVADPDRQLQGTVWEVNNYIDGETAMGLMDYESPRITFAADGSWQARSPCLEASGRYAVEGNRITLSGTTAKQGECADNDKVAAEFVRSVLVDGALTFAIEARTLTLKGSPRSLGANAAASETQ
jgi:heat shock protein HslJ